jgi:N-acetylglutamate synthase-like GNAT family acetyltransferase
MTVSIRPATENDQAQILALARGERIKPFGLDWPNFVVAEQSGRLVGAVQLRSHRDGSLELGSLVVASVLRKQGIAARLIDRRLEGVTGRVLMITSRRYAEHYSRWGFARIVPAAAPSSICLHYWMGHLGGRVMSILQWRAFNPLAVLDRQA